MRIPAALRSLIPCTVGERERGDREAFLLICVLPRSLNDKPTSLQFHDLFYFGEDASL